MDDCTNSTESSGATVDQSESIRPSWERRNDLGFVKAFRLSCDEICYDADQTFQAMPREGDLSGPLLFVFLGHMAIWGYLFLVCAIVCVFQLILVSTGTIAQTEFAQFYFAILSRSALLVFAFPSASFGWMGIASLGVYVIVRFQSHKQLQLTAIIRAFCYAMGEAIYLQRWMLPVVTIVICAFWFALFCMSLAFSSEMFFHKDIPSVILFSSLLALFISSIGSLSQFHRTVATATFAITGRRIAPMKLDIRLIAATFLVVAWARVVGVIVLVVFATLVILTYWKQIHTFIRLFSQKIHERRQHQNWHNE